MPVPNPILIVDDSIEACRMTYHVMRHFGYAAECVYGGEEALARLARDPLPALVILDQMMPDLDGIEVLRQIRRQPRTAAVPVFMYTAMQDDTFREYALRMGATDFWSKAGTEFEQMETRLRELLGNPQTSAV